MKITIESIDPFQPSVHLTLDQLPILIGRDGDAHVKLQDRWVSRRHCEICADHGSLIIRDLKSKHGTLLNGEVVQRSPLLPGDRLTVGIRTFCVSYRKAAARNSSTALPAAPSVLS